MTTTIPTLDLPAYLATLPNRCPHGFHIATQHPHLCDCAASTQPAADEWSTFTAALRQVVRPDGTVHANDVRPIIRGRVYHKRIGRFYKRAKDEGLLTLVEREPSSDTSGRNTHHDASVYRLGRAA